MSNHPHSALVTTPPKAPPRREIPVDRMLERWGLRVCGGTLKNPMKLSTGGEPSPDDDLRLVDYVESTPGFERARPALQWRFVQGKPFSSFQLCRPGESRSLALIRLGWFGLIGLPDAKIPEKIVKEFEIALKERLLDLPFLM